MSTILVIGDLHAPVMHPGAVDFLADLKKTFKPDAVVQVGELFDGYTFSKFMRDPDTPNAVTEIESTIEALQPLYKLFPDMSVCYGNHCLRHMKRATEAGLPSILFKSFKDLLECPKGWNFAEKFHIEDDDVGTILFHHGDGAYGSPNLRRMLQTLRVSHVIGHQHSEGGAIVYEDNGSDVVFAANAGCLVDHDTYAFRYSKNSRFRGVLGALIIVNGVPAFIPMRDYSSEE